MFDSKSDHQYILDALKQVGFYSDCLGKAQWSIPSEVIDESLARHMVLTARIVAAKRESLLDSPEALRIWAKYFSDGNSDPRRDLIKVDEELNSLGLVDNSQVQKMKRFVIGSG